MPNIGSVLKTEISRVARKEVRSGNQQLKQTITQYRRQLAQLRKRMDVLERMLKRQSGGRRTAAGDPPQDAPDAQEGTSLRFSAKGLMAQRQRLGLSAASMAKLLGVSALSVYKWESGKTRPRARQIEAIAAVRRLGKREAAARLEA